MHKLPPAKVSIALRANLSLLTNLTIKALEGLEQLTELNWQAMKASLAESRDTTHQALAVKDAQALLALQVGLMRPAGEQMLSYHRHLYGIALATQAEFAEATGAEFEAHNRRVKALVDNLMTSASPEAHTAVGVLASVITATNQWCEALYQTATQAADVAEQNMLAADAKQATVPAPRPATT